MFAIVKNLWNTKFASVRLERKASSLWKRWMDFGDEGPLGGWNEVGTSCHGSRWAHALRFVWADTQRIRVAFMCEFQTLASCSTTLDCVRDRVVDRIGFSGVSVLLFGPGVLLIKLAKFLETWNHLVNNSITWFRPIKHQRVHDTIFANGTPLAFTTLID